jgi:hypothetical protein
MEITNNNGRNFKTISPSAKWILLMKGHTDIPYAAQTAELISYPEKFIPDFTKTYGNWTFGKPSFREAEDFFKKMGFIVEKEADIERSGFSSLKYLLKNASLKQLLKFRKTGNIHKSWLLRLADKQQ